MSGGERAVRADYGTSELVELGSGRVFPGLCPREIGNAELAIREARRLIVTHARGARLSLASVCLRPALLVVRGLPCPNGVAELDRGSIDVPVAVLA